MKTPMLAIVAAVLAFSPLAQAQSSGHNHASHGSPAASAEVAQGTGVLKKIDAVAGVVNITHDPIPALKWPAMTMDLKVRDKKLLEGFKPGQTVKFSLAKEPTEYVITSLTVVKK